MKTDVDAVGRMLTKGWHIRAMASFTLDAETFEYLKVDQGNKSEEAKS